MADDVLTACLAPDGLRFSTQPGPAPQAEQVPILLDGRASKTLDTRARRTHWIGRPAPPELPETLGMSAHRRGP
jgi:hypothetical protein